MLVMMMVVVEGDGCWCWMVVLCHGGGGCVYHSQVMLTADAGVSPRTYTSIKGDVMFSLHPAHHINDRSYTQTLLLTLLLHPQTGCFEDGVLMNLHSEHKICNSS